MTTKTPAMPDVVLRRVVSFRRQRLNTFRTLKAPACVIADAEEALARGEAELRARDDRALEN